jgi:hypothetical protein
MTTYQNILPGMQTSATFRRPARTRVLRGSPRHQRSRNVNKLRQFQSSPVTDRSFSAVVGSPTSSPGPGVTVKASAPLRITRYAAVDGTATDGAGTEMTAVGSLDY